MTVKAVVFRIAPRGWQAASNYGVICPLARYASVCAAATSRAERRPASDALWQRLEVELAAGLPPDVLPEESAVVQVLVPESLRHVLVVQYVAIVPVRAETPLSVAGRLDKLLGDLSA